MLDPESVSQIQSSTEHLPNVPPAKFKGRSKFPPLRIFLISLLVTTGASFHYGYQLTLTSPAEEAFVAFVNQSISAHYSLMLDRHRLEAIWSSIVAQFFVGAVFGSVSLSKFADLLGRRPGMVVANLAIVVSAALEAASKFINSIELFAFARILLGYWIIVGVGIGSVFLTECSPKYCRGAIGVMTAVMIQIGTIAGAIVGIPQLWGNTEQWWIAYAFEAALQMCIVCMLYPIHETPGFLLLHNRVEKCRQSIRFYFGNESSESMDARIDEIRLNLKASSNSLGMFAVWRDKSSPTSYRGISIAIVLGLCMAFCGVAVVNAFSVGILRNIGISSLQASLANVGVMGISLISGVISALLVDRLGRRPLMLGSFTAMIITNAFIAGLMHFYSHSNQSESIRLLLVFAVTLFQLEFTFGLGSLFYFIVTETVGQTVRSSAQGWAKLSHTFSRAVVLALYLPLRNMIGDGQAYALLFLPVLICSTVFIYYFMPETKNRNLVEVEAELERLPRIPYLRRKSK